MVVSRLVAELLKGHSRCYPNFITDVCEYIAYDEGLGAPVYELGPVLPGDTPSSPQEYHSQDQSSIWQLPRQCVAKDQGVAFAAVLLLSSTAIPLAVDMRCFTKQIQLFAGHWGWWVRITCSAAVVGQHARQQHGGAIDHEYRCTGGHIRAISPVMQAHLR